MVERSKVACFSGHRKLPEDCTELQANLEKTIIELIEQGVVFFGSGGALGFDQEAASAVLKLKGDYPHIRLVMVLPCPPEVQSLKWNDSKGDLYRNTATIAEKYYGYKISVIDLRNPTRSSGYNMLYLVNKYMDAYKTEGKLEYKAKSEKFAKTTAKTIISADGDVSSMGQNAFFYEAAEGLLTAVILLIAEFCPPEKRHIISVFKLIQDLLAPSGTKGVSRFQMLIDKLPGEHKARWFAGAALNSSDQTMASVMSTALSRLNSFIDSELEQILCFDTSIDVEEFCNSKSAIYLVLPEEDTTKHFLISLIFQQLYREILTVADEKGGQLDKRVMFYMDEIGSATRS